MKFEITLTETDTGILHRFASVGRFFDAVIRVADASDHDDAELVSVYARHLKSALMTFHLQVKEKLLSDEYEAEKVRINGSLREL
jgi:hypothetical protein